MQINRRVANWGLFFIVLGAVPLAVRQGWLSQTAVGDAWRLWPLLLVAAGLGILLARSRLHVLGGLLTAATLGLIVGGALAGGVAAIGCGGGTSSAALPAAGGTFGTAASVEITIDCGAATLTTASGSGWSFSGTGDATRPPQISSNTDTLRIGTSRGGDLFQFSSARPSWLVQLPTSPTLDLSLTMNAGSARLDLAGAHLGGLSLTGNAGAVRIDLSKAASTGSFDATINAGEVLVALPDLTSRGSVTVNAGRFGFCAPPGAGLRIETGGALSGNNFGERGLIQDGNTWTTPGFGGAEVRIDLQARANVGSLELNPEGGCQ